jgi:hypothetical protein
MQRCGLFKPINGNWCFRKKSIEGRHYYLNQELYRILSE